jgi:hypothetical protein
MSTPNSRLRDPRVIVTVVLLLLAVAAANVVTFAPSLMPGSAARPDAVQTAAVPNDLDQLARAAGRGGTLLGDGSAGRVSNDGCARTGSASGLRDPFHPRATAPVPRPSDEALAPPESPPELRCSAVLLGGVQPLAMLDGQMLGVGDRVRGWRIEHISPRGVRLKRGSEERSLTVEGATPPDLFSPLVTERGERRPQPATRQR